MDRRGFLSSFIAAGAVGAAGCAQFQTDDEQPTPEGTPIDTPQPTPEPPDRVDDREWLADAIRIEMILNGISVNEVEWSDNTLVVDYSTLPDGSAAELRGRLQIAAAFHDEILAFDTEPESLQVWVEHIETGEQIYRFEIDPEWVMQWMRGRLTDAQLLASIGETIVEP